VLEDVLPPVFAEAGTDDATADGFFADSQTGTKSRIAVKSAAAQIWCS
jgi:hypothetical protein